MKKIVFLALVSCAFAFSGLAQDHKNQKMIRIDFSDTRPDGVEFQMTLPISVILSFQPQIREVFDNLQAESDSVDFVEIWQTIKATGPNDYLEMKGKDGNVKISTTQSHFVALIDTEEEGQIEAMVPLALGDLLFNKGQAIDLDSVIVALESLQGQDLVKVRSEFINGRIWIE